MTPTTVISVGRQAIEVALMLAGPPLLVAMTVGVVVSILQAATQIQETSLSFIPKLLALFAVLMVAGPWMLTIMTDYIRNLYISIPSLIAA